MNIYISEKEASKMGFTHHGRYFFVPIWITDEEVPMVAAKFAPFELLISVSHCIEGLLASILWPDAEPSFQFMIGREINGA